MRIIKTIFFFPNTLFFSIHLFILYWKKTPKELSAIERMVKLIDFIGQDSEQIRDYMSFMHTNYRALIFVTSFCVWTLIIKLIL